MSDKLFMILLIVTLFTQGCGKQKFATNSGPGNREQNTKPVDPESGTESSQNSDSSGIKNSKSVTADSQASNTPDFSTLTETARQNSPGSNTLTKTDVSVHADLTDSPSISTNDTATTDVSSSSSLITDPSSGTERSIGTRPKTGTGVDTLSHSHISTDTKTAVSGPVAKILSGLTPYQFNGIQYPTSKSSLEISISEEGENASGKLSHYLYSLTKGNAPCSNSLDGYRDKSISEPIRESLSEFGYHTLCILGKSSQGNVQNFPATQYQFYRFPKRPATAIAPIQSGIGTLADELWVGNCEVPASGTPTSAHLNYIKKYTVRCGTPLDRNAPTAGASGKLIWTLRYGSNANSLLPEVKQIHDVSLIHVEADDKVTARDISGTELFSDLINKPFTANPASISALFLRSTSPEVKFDTLIEDVYSAAIHANFTFVVTYFEEQ